MKHNENVNNVDLFGSLEHSLAVALRRNRVEDYIIIYQPLKPIEETKERETPLRLWAQTEHGTKSQMRAFLASYAREPEEKLYNCGLLGLLLADDIEEVYNNHYFEHPEHSFLFVGYINSEFVRFVRGNQDLTASALGVYYGNFLAEDDDPLMEEFLSQFSGSDLGFPLN